MPSETLRPILEDVVQIALAVVPIAIAWLIRSYVKNSNSEKRLATVVRLSGLAIDYVENLEKRGLLRLPAGMSKGAHKLGLAADRLTEELKRNGVSVTADEATKWISSVFQNRVGGGVLTTSIAAEVTAMAVDLMQGVERGNLLASLHEPERLELMTGLAADWLVTELANRRGVHVAREEAECRIRAELLNRLQIKLLPSGDPLTDLAHQAVGFLNGLKRSGRLKTKPSMEHDVAVAWMLTEAAKQGLSVAPDQITSALSAALRETAATPSV